MAELVSLPEVNIDSCDDSNQINHSNDDKKKNVNIDPHGSNEDTVSTQSDCNLKCSNEISSDVKKQVEKTVSTFIYFVI